MFEFAKCRIPMICRIGSINVFLKASLVVNFKNIQNERMWQNKHSCIYLNFSSYQL